MKDSSFKPYVFVLDVLKEDIHDQKGVYLNWGSQYLWEETLYEAGIYFGGQIDVHIWGT